MFTNPTVIPSILSKAEIFTYSFAGMDPVLRQKRLAIHKQQLTWLAENSPDLVVVSYEMMYTEEEQEFIRTPGITHIFVPDKLLMGEARNLMISTLHACGGDRYVLILDDDTTPMEKEDISITPIDLIRKYLKGRPAYRPTVIACQDVYRNIYYEKTLTLLKGRVSFEQEAILMKGSMFMVHSSCDVLFRGKIKFCEESYFRMDCLLKGHEVMKCSHLLLREAARKDEDSSVIEMVGETHTEAAAHAKRALAAEYPQYISLKAGVRGKDRIGFNLRKPPPVILTSDLKKVVSGRERGALL